MRRGIDRGRTTAYVISDVVGRDPPRGGAVPRAGTRLDRHDGGWYLANVDGELDPDGPVLRRSGGAVSYIDAVAASSALMGCRSPSPTLR